jgi:hypothetical protein
MNAFMLHWPQQGHCYVLYRKEENFVGCSLVKYLLPTCSLNRERIKIVRNSSCAFVGRFNNVRRSIFCNFFSKYIQNSIGLEIILEAISVFVRSVELRPPCLSNNSNVGSLPDERNPNARSQVTKSEGFVVRSLAIVCPLGK